MYVSIKKLNYNNICISNFIGAILSIPIFLILFLPTFNIIGENLIVTIVIMFITIAICELISYKIMNKPEHKLENDTIFFAIGVYILFIILTYFPPHFGIFMDQTTSTYGIKK